MLSTAHKALLLRRHGLSVPAWPEEDTVQWRLAIDAQFDDYMAQRAARGRREAEEARELELLTRLAATSYLRRRVTNYA